MGELKGALGLRSWPSGDALTRELLASARALLQYRLPRSHVHNTSLISHRLNRLHTHLSIHLLSLSFDTGEHSFCLMLSKVAVQTQNP